VRTALFCIALYSNTSALAQLWNIQLLTEEALVPLVRIQQKKPFRDCPNRLTAPSFYIQLIPESTLLYLLLKSRAISSILHSYRANQPTRKIAQNYSNQLHYRQANNPQIIVQKQNIFP